MIIKTNALVLYKNKPAVVTDIANDKYTIRTASGDSKSVRAKDIIFLHPGPCNAIPQVPVMPSAEAQMEVAELIGSDNMPFAEFVELLFNSCTPAAAIAAFELVSENCYFSGTPTDGVRANSAEHIKAILEKEQLKQAAKQSREDLLNRIKNGAVTEDDRPQLREIENVAYGASSSSKLMHDLGMEALPEKAQDLLLKLGVWDDFANNPWPRRYDIPLEMEYPILSDELPAEERVDLTHLTAYAIDDADSNDPDDAISYDAENDWVWVHIADPGAAIKLDSELEKFACNNGCTLYLPEKIVHMLPEKAVPIFGLGLQETSPALSFALAFDASGNVELKKLVLSTVKVTRMNYVEGDQLMNDVAFKPLVDALERFRNMRAANNAVMIRLPEVKIKVNIPRENITVTPLPQTPVRELVANAMMATGHAVAKFAVANDIALPFAVQEDPEMSERPDTLPGMYALRKSCRQSILSTLPGKHAGLGLEPYARVTSPLRRYEDLLSHIQLRRFIAGETPLSISELDERIATSEPAAVLRSKLERQCREYWTLVKLKNELNTPLEAIYIAKLDERNTWVLPELAFEFKNRYHVRLPLGEKMLVECIASNPALLSTQFKFAKNSAGSVEEVIEELPEETAENMQKETSEVVTPEVNL